MADTRGPGLPLAPSGIQPWLPGVGASLLCVGCPHCHWSPQPATLASGQKDPALVLLGDASAEVIWVGSWVHPALGRWPSLSTVPSTTSGRCLVLPVLTPGAGIVETRWRAFAWPEGVLPTAPSGLSSCLRDEDPGIHPHSWCQLKISILDCSLQKCRKAVYFSY